jgi:acyl carrier protein
LIDQTFKVKIKTSDLPSVKTFAALYEYIEQHQA